MGFFSKLFGSRSTDRINAEGSEDQTSIAGLLRQMDKKATIARCGVSRCGLSFPSFGSACLVMFSPSSLMLDCGGYCPKCGYYVCHRHAKLVDPSDPSFELRGTPRWTSRTGIVGVGCGRYRSSESCLARTEEVVFALVFAFTEKTVFL